MRARRVWWLAVASVLLGAALTVPFRHLWEVDEPRYAQAAREMVASGQWLVPHLYGEPYTHKPPLFLWLEAVLQVVGFPWTAAAVLPSLLAFLGIAVLLPRLARAAGLPDETGRLAAVVLASSPLVAFLALGARMDMLLAFFHTLALLMLARLIVPPAAAPAALRRAHLTFWLAIGLGVLTKGPVALALPLSTVLLAWLVPRPRPSLGGVFRGPGPLLCLGVVLAWLVPAALAGGADYLYEVTIRQSAGRVTNSFAHQEPFYFYLLRYPLVGLPWSLAAIVAAFHALRRRALDGGGFLAIGALAVPALFSLVSGKLEIYLLPLFPPAAIVVVHSLRREDAGLRPALALGASGMVLVGAAAALVPRLGVIQSVPWPAWVAVGALIAGPAVAAVWQAARRRPLAATAALVAASGLAVPAALLPLGINAMDASQSAAGAAVAITRAEPGTAELLRYGAAYAGLWLYSDRPYRELHGDDELGAELGRGRCVLVEDKKWLPVREALATRVGSVERLPIRRRALFVVCGRVSPTGS